MTHNTIKNILRENNTCNFIITTSKGEYKGLLIHIDEKNNVVTVIQKTVIDELTEEYLKLICTDQELNNYVMYLDLRSIHNIKFAPQNIVTNSVDKCWSKTAKDIMPYYIDSFPLRVLK